MYIILISLLYSLKTIYAVFSVALYFGIITCVAGIIGVFFGSESARWLRRINPRADPLVCAFGLIVCAPFLFLVIFVAKYNTTATWVSNGYLLEHYYI